MKKLMSLLLAAAMLLSCMPMGAFAAENAYYVAGSEALCGNAWACNDANNQMTLNADGLYEKTFTDVPAGDHEFKVTDGTWDNSWGKNGGSANYAFTTTEEATEVTITFDADTKAIVVYLNGAAIEEPVAEASYYVAGSAALCGNAWACDDAANKMSLNADGLYEKTFTDVPAGTHEFKVTDGTWDNCWGNGGSNYTFTTTEVRDVTILFNADTKAIEVVLGDVVPGETDPSEPEETEPVVEEDLYTVAGTEDLCGSGWTPGDMNNKMSLNTETGLYEKYYIGVPAGTHQFKVTDGSWSNSWGKDGGSDNFEFVTEKEQNVLITFNAETKEITVTLIDIDPYYVAGSGSLCGVDWDPGYAANKMFLDSDGLYKKVFQGVQAGTHECKITAGDWGTNWGVGGANGANYTIVTDAAYDVTVIFNPETLEISHTLAEPTAVEPSEPVEYDITIKVHYYRPDGDYSSWEVHMWNGVESLSSTRKFELEETVYDGTTYGATATYHADASDTWVGFIIKKPDWTKDPDGDRKIDISDVLSGTVHVYAKTGSSLEDFATDKSEATLGAKITAAVYDSLTGILTVTTSMPVENLGLDTFTLEGPDGEMIITAVTDVDGAGNYIVEYEGEINADEVFTVYYNGAPCVVTVPNTYSTETFESQYTYEGDDLGANWSAESTTFRVWAPTATAVSVNLYTNGTDGAPMYVADMTPDVNGTWVITFEGDLNGMYYTYSVTRKGETVEAVDPYARTTGVNGNRGMVVDLDSTDPDGWENDDYVTQSSYTDAVIWELHVRDFSIDASSGISEANRGKYLAFTERGTTVPGTDIATGVDYMVNLGVNYVHLLPVYDINSVDETVGGYNWGYDPKNYNVPEGSYSTDPYNGAVRVTEFKQMVQSLHDAGIGVVMDVVYNHVADAGNFCFNQIVPGYFSRIHDDGSYQSNSGCGNDTASERSMVRKYIVDSVLYWAEEYHIDGFRWDLVGLIDYETINEVMEEVHKVNPDIIFYGEGWEMCSWTTKEGYVQKMTIQNNDKLVNTEAGVFAFFNDTIRNVIHGGVFTATDKGFVCGNLSDGTKQTVIDGYMAYSVWGSAGQRVDTPLQTINYASCHDNYTLFDNFTVDAMDLTGKTAEEVKEQAAAYNNMAAAYYITAQGVPFIHAGEEMLRSKPDSAQDNGFNHNSYASGDAINSFKWSELQNELNAASYEYYKGLIAFRKAHPALRMTEQSEILAAMEALDTGSNNIIAILNNGGNGEDAEILTIINTGDEATFTLPEGEWDVYVTKYVAGTSVQASGLTGDMVLEPVSVTILIKAEKSEAVVFKTFEELKQLVAENQSEYIGEVNYIGTEPLVIEEDIHIPWTMGIGSHEQPVIVPENVTLQTDNLFYATELTIEGTMNAVAVEIGDALTVNGALNVTAQVYLHHQNVVLIGEENINFLDAAILCLGYDVRSMDELLEAVNIAVADTNPRHLYSTFIMEEMTIDQSLTLPDNFQLMNDAPVTIAAGCTLTTSYICGFRSAVTVEGTLVNTNGISFIHTDIFKGSLTIAEGGEYMGAGIIRVYIPGGDDPTVVLSGIDTSRFDIVFDERGGGWIMTPKAMPAPVVKASNVASTGKIKLIWNAVDGAAKYQVYRSTDKENWTLLKTMSGTSLTNTSAKAGELYYYYVVAVDANGNTSDASEIVSRVCALARPELTLSNVASNGKIKVTWTAVAGAVKYEVYVSTDKENWDLLKTVTGTYVNHLSAEANTRYYYKVRALAEREAANSAFSAVKNLTCDLARPVVTLKNVASTGKIKITWKAVEGAKKYEVYVSTDKENWTLLKTVSGTSLTHASAETGKLYYYQVKAIGSSSYADSALSTVKSRYCDLARPTLTVTLNSKDKPYLSWNKVTGAVKYEVYVSVDDGETWVLLKTMIGTRLTHASAEAGTTYSYRVRAIANNAGANSAYSTVKSATAG